MDPGGGASGTWPAGVEVRRTRSEDRELLVAYFDELPPDDRRLRFFGPSRTASHIDRWLALEDAGGETFIVLTTADDGSPRCIGEAGYAPRGDGTAEFALSVAADARGGLGAALVDHLRRAAGARGVQALHGDVLLGNGPMNHLMRRRGGVTIDRVDTTSVGVIIATSDGVPPWPEDEYRRGRVLIEARNGRWAGETRLREAGFQVAVCPGPGGRTASDPCPLQAGEPCALVDGADVVVHDLSPDETSHRRVAAALATTAGRTPVITREPGEQQVGREVVEAALLRSCPAS